MAIQYRLYTITDEGDRKHVFKHYPGDGNKIVVLKDEIDSSLHAREDLLALIRVASSYMEDNTICKVEIEEDEEE